MRYFLLDGQGRPVGPYSREELRLFLDRGLIDAATPVASGVSTAPRAVGVLLTEPPPLITSAGREGGDSRGGVVTERGGMESVDGGGLGSDLLKLAPHLMLPLEDIRRLRWLDNRRILGLAAIGLLPLLLLSYLGTTGDLAGSIWGVALYSSLLWALFFYVAFSQPEVTFFQCVSAYLGSAVFSIGLVALVRHVLPVTRVLEWIQVAGPFGRWTGYLFGVAIIEEAAKMFMLYVLWTRRLPPRTMMFYGLMAGLGFGIYEGVAYQSSQNLKISFPTGQPTAEGAAVYYMLNILRITSLPFLHAMWTGIAGYFIGFAGQYPSRRGGLLFAAVAVPSLLHATYNTFSTSLIGFTVAFITVLALNLYLVKGRDFEAVLAGGRSGRTPWEAND